MPRPRTQTERVLAALRHAGPAGLTAYDLAGPVVADGGDRIMRVAARILELRNQGHVIVKRGRRDGHDVYVLEAPSPHVTRTPDADRLFAPPVAPLGAFDNYYGEAA